MPKYSDEEFLEVLPDRDVWTSTHLVANQVGCGLQTANRRLIQLAKEGDVEVADSENNCYGIPENESTSRLFAYRTVPDDRDPLTGEFDP